MKNDETLEHHTEKQQAQERVPRELRNLHRDHRQNILDSSETIADLHEATRFVIFLEAIASSKFVQDRRAHRDLHKENAKFVSFTGGITPEAKGKFGWCLDVRTAATAWFADWKATQANKYGSNLPRA